MHLLTDFILITSDCRTCLNDDIRRLINIYPVTAPKKALQRTTSYLATQKQQASQVYFYPEKAKNPEKAKIS
ncbi:MAG: hypothetical protein ACJAYW_000395 [Candidatus Azotimanducaceae bacterium]|jgi:hypothetical protein